MYEAFEDSDVVSINSVLTFKCRSELKVYTGRSHNVHLLAQTQRHPDGKHNMHKAYPT